MNGFKVGDVVVLNSGGPLMVISTTPSVCVADDHARVLCVWITPAGKHQASTFKIACLRQPTAIERHEAGRLPTYASHASRGPLRVCQDCGGIATDRHVYGIKRWTPMAEGSNVTFGVVDWLTLCDLCAEVRGFTR